MNTQKVLTGALVRAVDTIAGSSETEWMSEKHEKLISCWNAVTGVITKK